MNLASRLFHKKPARAKAMHSKRIAIGQRFNAIAIPLADMSGFWRVSSLIPTYPVTPRPPRPQTQRRAAAALSVIHAYTTNHHSQHAIEKGDGDNAGFFARRYEVGIPTLVILKVTPDGGVKLMFLAAEP